MVDALRHSEERALEAVEAHFGQRTGASKLDDGELKKRSHWEPLAGWRLQVAGDTVDVIVCKGFPYSLPMVFLTGPDKMLQWPHVERGNRLCVLPNHATFDPERPVALIDYVLAQTEELLRELHGASARSDFVDEFQRYWALAKSSGQSIVSLVSAAGPSREIFYWAGTKQTYVADSTADGARWLQRYHGSVKGRREADFKKTVLLWLDSPLEPPYELTGTMLRGLVTACGMGASLDGLVARLRNSIPIVLGFATDGGPTLCAVWLSSPTKAHGRRGTRKSLSDGFRGGAVPAEVAWARLQTSRAVVARADAAWIHGRGGGGYEPCLSEQTVILVGCGALGAGVAEQLSQSGIGHLHLVDPDVLEWDNVGRHQVGGATAIGRNKVDVLKENLERRLPHVNVEATAYRWQDLWRKAPDVFLNAQAVVSTIGDWPSEAALNLLARREVRFPSTVFGWVEAHAAAAHVLIVLDVGGCLRCGVSGAGLFRTAAVEWGDEHQMVQVPACGGYYQPYGAIDLAPSHPLVAEAVLDVLRGRAVRSQHRAWFGSVKRIEGLGGRWRQVWAEGPQAIGDGLCVRVVDWPAECPLCSGPES